MDIDGGARWVVLCDTNGVALLPHEIEVTVGEVAKVVPGSHLGIHASMTTPGQLIRLPPCAGVRQVQGTNGIGERCNATQTIIATRPLPEFSDCRLASRSRAARELTHVSRAFDDVLEPLAELSRALRRLYFRRLLGVGIIHASAIVKDPKTY